LGIEGNNGTFSLLLLTWRSPNSLGMLPLRSHIRDFRMTFLTSENRIPFTRIEMVVWLLGLASLSFSLYATSIGFHNTLFDFHGFRQAQTAISAESILRGGSFLRYETPVLGPPWSLPFEFPLYQGVVAGLAKILSTPLDQTGRFVSIFFYYLCFFPLASILSSTGLRGVQMIPSLALFAVSPLYVFVSRLFMIESTALFFSLLYADQMFRLVLGKRRWQPRHIAGGAVFGVLAGLVKVTTLAPFFALGTCLAAWGLWKDRESGKLRVSTLMGVALCCLALPVTATWWWTRFADGVRAQNPIGIYLTSNALRTWTVGTIAQRLHPRVYLQLWYAADNHVGNIWMAVVVFGIYIWLCRRWNWIAAVCLALYIGTILIFFNLHVVHEYYPYANAVFLVVAVGVLITSILTIPGKRSWIGVALLVLAMVSCGLRYFGHYYPLQVRNAPGRPQAVALVDTTTAPQSVILITGLEWSAEFPYQSHRRAIMDAFFPQTHTWTLGPVERVIATAGAKNVTALIACDEGRHGPRLAALLRDLGLTDATGSSADDCDIYERTTALGSISR
jgi:hypothetical protein